MEQPELSKTYNAQDWEDALYQSWLESGFFNPDTCIEKGVSDPQKLPFSMILPPPNATGTLHTGSACMLAIEDTFVRFARMQGHPTLWLPGTDHAAIATQSKVERLLWEEEQQTRYDLGREELLKRIALFVQKNQDTMHNQMRKMGSSLDWSREAFTLDTARNLAVNKAFKMMYDDGLIVRGDRIVNWDPKGQTTISDDEVVHQEEVSQFYYLQYGPFEIATARPETKFGDKYVVMHPDDPRYAKYADRDTFELEWINGPITATIIKDSSIDMDFGTGVMTITPWHSMADFEIAERHSLDREQIIDLQGKLLPIAGEFAGLSIKEARAQIIAKLQSKGLVTKIEEGYVHQIATAERTGETIEPQIMRQWFIQVNQPFMRDGKEVTLKSLMREAVHPDGVHILPERFEKIYFHWIDNLRDWCISRQIWYGHRIPVYYRGDEMICSETTPDGDGWEQDSDTLDTWFSSGLWTFSTLGWGSDEAKWAREKMYHPTTLLNSGYDLIFFWIARMILMSQYFVHEIPFKTVYLHGLVRDEQGRKMSKSLDNIIDPLDVIKDYGADALRLALISGNTPGNDARLSDEKIVTQRNFVNKLWNMSRYVLSTSNQQLTTSPLRHVSDETSDQPVATTLADQWILATLEEVTRKTTEHLTQYRLSLAVETLRDFTLNDFADWYIEIHKIEKNDSILVFVMTELLKLWHPFAPFVTEALWSQWNKDSLLLVTRWPDTEGVSSTSGTTAFETIQTLITRVRNIRATYRIAPKLPLKAILLADDTTLYQDNLTLITAMTTLDLTLTDTLPEANQYLRIVEGPFSLFINLTGVVDFNAEKLRLENEIAEATKHFTSLDERLSDTRFTDNAPASIIQAQSATRDELHQKIITLNTTLKEISTLD